MNNYLKACSEFSDRIDHHYTGSLFRNADLFPKLEEAIKNDIVLFVDMDGVEGITPLFLQEAFGYLVSVNGIKPELIKKHMIVLCVHNSRLREDIDRVIEGKQYV